MVPPNVSDVKELKCCNIRTLLVGSSVRVKLAEMSNKSSRSVSTRSTDMEYMSGDNFGLLSSRNSVFGELEPICE